MANNSKLPSVRKYSQEYSMDHSYRGKALIFNHEYFLNDQHPPRMGTAKDKEVLRSTFHKFGFHVQVYDNLSYQLLLQTLEEVSQEDHSDRDCIVIAVLSHGNLNILEAYDRSYEQDQLFSPFYAQKCPTLAGKPKIFFIQACRGPKQDEGMIVCTKLSRIHSSDYLPFEGKGKTELRVSNQRDFLIFDSCHPGHASIRNELKGSLFIQTLCRVLTEQGQEMDLLSITTVVNHELSTKYCEVPMKSSLTAPEYPSLSPRVPEIQIIQCSVVQSSLTRKIYFRAKADGEYQDPGRKRKRSITESPVNTTTKKKIKINSTCWQNIAEDSDSDSGDVEVVYAKYPYKRENNSF